MATPIVGVQNLNVRFAGYKARTREARLDLGQSKDNEFLPIEPKVLQE